MCNLAGMGLHVCAAVVQVMPLQNKDPLVGIANDVAGQLLTRYKVDFDASGSIGARMHSARRDRLGFFRPHLGVLAVLLSWLP